MTFSELESIRKEYSSYYNKIKRTCFLVCSIPLAITLLFSLINTGGRFFIFSLFPVVFFGIFSLVVSLIVVSFATKKPRERYERAYKEYFVCTSLKTIFKNVEYEPSMGISPDVLRNTGMMYTGDRYLSNDFVKGEYKDVEFSQADVFIEEEHKDSDGDSTYVTVFRGRWMTFEFPKKFAFKLEVVQRGFCGAIVPRSSKTGKRIKRIETESITFNKLFNVYAEDGFEMFYILTPDIIERIEELASNPKSRVILCFVDNKLHVGLHNNTDAFEAPNPHRPIDEKAECERISSDISVIVKFIDSLKLDRNLFKN